MTRQRICALGVPIALLVLLVPTLTTNAEPASVDPAVWQVLEAEGQVDILVMLTEQADLSGALALATKEEKGWYVYQQLTATAERTQPPLRAYLDRQGIPYQSYWIRNMIRVQADAALAQALARRPEVARIDYHHPVELEPILSNEPVSDESSAIGWNIQRVHADDVWAMGIDGDGVLVGIIDSGVDWDHPALISAYRPWVPGAPTRHDYNWYDGHGGSQTPVDYTGHGTAITGLVVGDDGGAHRTGMAPGAQWIGCSMLSNHGMDCLQFMLAPTKLDGSDPRPDLAPHVLSNSWVARVDYEEIIDTLYFAGIMFVKAAENDGYDCGTVSSPGSLPRVTAVGAFKEGDAITSFSSRGPMLYNGQTIIKPNLAAPGMNCPTTTNGGGYGNSAGTSAACPHVTGAVALILSARPDLAGRIDTLQMILQESAEPMIDLQCPPNDPSGRPNNVWGYGILNAYNAVVMAQGLGMGGLQGRVNDADTGQPIPWAKISFADSAGRALLGTDVTDGAYTHTLPAATYTVTLDTYGYYPGVVGSIVVTDGGLTIQDISLTARPAYILSGTVRAAESGAPLSATVTALYTPLSPVQSDPATGFYSITLAGGSHTLQVEAFQRLSEEHIVEVEQDQTLDLDLESIPFIPYPGNPVLEPGTGGAWDSQVVAAPNVVFVDGIFYLFYLGSSASNPGAIGYATSTDGISFQKYAGNPILAGDGSGFDAGYVGFPAVLVENGTWIMHYVGQGGEGQMKIGRATAPAPSGPWTRNSNPVLSPGSFWEWDGSWMLPNNLFSTGSSYVLYYTAAGIAPHRSKLGRAVSTDGITWSKYNDPSTGSPYAESDPVMKPGPPGAWDYRYIFRSSVQQTTGGWEVFYGAYGSLLLDSAVGYANSVDGIHWSKDARNPILQPKDEPMAAAYLQNPSVVRVGSTDWLYYDDMEYFDDINTHIGVAKSTMYQPAIVVEPLALETSLYADQQLTQTLWISNVGEANLDFDIYEMSWVARILPIPAAGLPTGSPTRPPHSGPGLGQETFALDLIQGRTIITDTALCIKDLRCSGTPCPDRANNVYGWGRIDAFQAVSLTLGNPDLPYDIPWLAESPVSGTLGSGEGIPVAVTYDATSLDAGTYLGLLDVESNDPTTPHVSVPVTLTVLACQPVHDVDFFWEPTTPLAGQGVTLTATATGTPPISYTWDLGDGTFAGGEVVYYSYLHVGPYTVVLTATNCATATDTASHTLMVVPFCEPVHDVTLDWEPVTPTVGAIVTFTAEATGTQPITLTWDFGDGVQSGGAVVTHTYKHSGTYAMLLTATNPCGEDVVEGQISVVEVPTHRLYLPVVLRGSP